MTGTIQPLEAAAGVASIDWKPYPAYKDSGVEWLGRVPEHWDLCPALGAYQPVCERNRGMKEGTVLSLSYGRIVVRPPEKLHGLVPESFETYQIANPGDIILRTTDLQNDHTSLRVGRVRQRGIITSAYLNLRVQPGMCAEYGYQFLNVWDTTKDIYAYGSGLRQNLGFSHFKRMPVVIPPPAEQDAIVSFLNYHDRLIRKYIRAKQKLIALLTEQKQTIIQHAVTRGLNPDVKLKPSGEEWLGSIPAHWNTYLAMEAFDPKCIRNIGLKERKVLSLSYGRIIVKPEEKLRGLVPESFETYQIVEPDDIIIRTTDLQNDHTSLRVGLVRDHGIITAAYLCLSTRPILLSSFAHLYLHTWDVTKAIYGYGSGLRQNLDFKHFRRMNVPVPPPEEQQAITRHIDRETMGMTEAILRAEKEIALMREYRTRLTADVVTGKIDVRAAATALPVDLADLVGDDDALTDTADDDVEVLSSA